MKANSKFYIRHFKFLSGKNVEFRMPNVELLRLLRSVESLQTAS